MTEKIKLAVVFAGQGAQKPGMGKSLNEASAAVRAVFGKAGEGIRFDCFEAGADRLKETEVTQPAVYTMDFAAYAAFLEALDAALGGEAPQPCAVAGFSLGEYAAFAAAGVIGSFEEGLELVRTRSLLMKDAGRWPDGSPRGTMAAAMGSREAVLALVEKTRGDDVLEAVNFNSPTQTVVAGDVSAAERFAAAAKEDRSLGVKAIPLAVSGAFHSPIMAPAAEGLAAALEDYTFHAPKIPVFVNVTGKDLMDGTDVDSTDAGGTGVGGTGAGGGTGVGGMGVGGGADGKSGGGFDSERVKDVMLRQIKSPVQWQATVENLAAAGVNTIVEVGPGKTLSGLAKKIAPELDVYHIEDAETLAATVAAIAARQGGSAPG
jgi:[acyl-carrier-protein] S-malonyltransferase